MSDRIANIVFLVEDQEQQNLVYYYVRRCNPRVTFRDCRVEMAAKSYGGSAEQFVRDRYPAEVSEHRRRVDNGASGLLVVMIDADRHTTQTRKRQLSDALEAAISQRRRRQRRRARPELIVLLIPKRHVETWIRALLGNGVEEHTDYKNPKPTTQETRTAAETLYPWTRRNANPGATCPPSLTESLPEWQKIP